jgi:hypothetical protein
MSETPIPTVPDTPVVQTPGTSNTIKEVLVDVVAVGLIATRIYIFVTHPEVTIPTDLATLFGVAAMYIFGKYTPNSA